ncbi:hypothetical protein QNA08_02765 [Chelatococcus sp. SYSU_G07232]|uniref:YARHG domain-containing protein n=1 Tax=Chelatococcus albus TaxID=3047466 RepID=A0ABT7ACR1_9HYPH|nr:hypothetical protein [Chelatococcus sp. SYSU_G07232]MDJ1157160.1 hypothetical protein [Chelatococcus sp. SYSU_G07232]
MRGLLLVAIGLFVATSAFAAGSTAALPPPDPTAARLSRPQIGERAYKGCLVTQAQLQGTPQETLRSPCRCYANRTIAAMGEDEVAAFRQTGYFNDVTRAKALAALDACNLKRPI